MKKMRKYRAPAVVQIADVAATTFGSNSTKPDGSNSRKNNSNSGN